MSVDYDGADDGAVLRDGLTDMSGAIVQLRPHAIHSRVCAVLEYSNGERIASEHRRYYSIYSSSSNDAFSMANVEPIVDNEELRAGT